MFLREFSDTEDTSRPKVSGNESTGGTGSNRQLSGLNANRKKSQCVEASTTAIDKSFFAPNLDWFDAKFSPEAVTYENDSPDCARYSVRIDLKLEKVFAVRDRKDNPKNKNCVLLERRIEMQLSDSFEHNANPLAGHFLPIFQFLRLLLN